MSREYIDFSFVPEHHDEMHMRLQNWARWCCASGRSEVMPMFRGMKPAQHWEAIFVQQPVDSLDGHHVEKAVVQLPDKHRAAVRWCYVYRTGPVATAKAIGCTLAALAALVKEGRQMLINRRV